MEGWRWTPRGSHTRKKAECLKKKKKQLVSHCECTISILNPATNALRENQERKFRPTCRQMARLTRQPKEVLTARGCSPRSLKSLEKDCVRAILGRSSATTTHVLTRDKSNPRDWSGHRGSRWHLVSVSRSLLSLHATLKRPYYVSFFSWSCLTCYPLPVKCTPPDSYW